MLGSLVVGGLLLCPVAIAADLWALAPLVNDASDSGLIVAEAVVGGAYMSDVVPPFRAGSRDRAVIDGTATVGLAQRVQIGVSGNWLREETPSGSVAAGFGDLRVGTAVRVARVGPVDMQLGWEAKLPNAADEGELGTDETDVLFGVGAGGQFGEFGAFAAVGLGVLGNPLRFANQDDVPLVRVAALWRRGTVAISPRFALDVGTARNPVRSDAGALVRVGKRGFIEVGGAAGLVPASPDWAVSVGFGWRAPLPTPASGE